MVLLRERGLDDLYVERRVMGNYIRNWNFDADESILRADCFVGLGKVLLGLDSQYDLLAMTDWGGSSRKKCAK